MPHVASQIMYQRPSGEIRSREVVTTMKRSAEFLRPATAVPRRRQPLDTEMPSLSLVVTNPDNPHWDFGSIQHLRTASHDTPVSAVDSVFELPSAGSYEETPNSSTDSLFVAELEDTSPHPFSKPHTSSDLPPKSPGPSTRSARSQSHLHTSSGTSISKTSILRIEPPQSPARSVKSPKSQSHLHPGSPAAIASSELYFDQPKSPSVKSSRSQSHLRSVSGVSAASTELDDVPPVPKKPFPPQLQPSANIKSRAAMAVETINAIEEDNRQLLERALAAEKRAKTLQEMNLTLQHRVAYCDQHHRPKTAPTRSRRAASESTPVSTFNTTPTRHRPAPLKLTPEMKSISHDYDLAARGSPTRPARRAQPQPQPQAYSQAADISGPIPGSVIRQQVTYKGTPISNAPPVATISLAEARRREKPLPYIMPMSPSAVPGFVEMGSRAEVCAEEKRELRKKKTFGDLFRRSKRPDVRV
jgi:hypothetical protein